MEGSLESKVAETDDEHRTTARFLRGKREKSSEKREERREKREERIDQEVDGTDKLEGGGQRAEKREMAGWYTNYEGPKREEGRAQREARTKRQARSR